MIGKKLSPVLSEIESALIEYELNINRPPQYTDEGFRASVKIFLSVMLDKMWKLQEDEGINIDTRADMAEKLGTEIRNIIRVYTNIDTHSLYK
jgi:hypothetical protein